MAWTFVCPTEIVAFSEAAPQFALRNTEVVFASTDSEYSLLAWTNTSKKDGGLGKVNIPLLSDKNHRLSRDYGVLLEEEGIALRGMFLIDPEGILRQVSPQSLDLQMESANVGGRLLSTICLLAEVWKRLSA
jgi:peroxiredoxin (alkyl hydroperoxide reductase subunit C)